MTSEQQRFSSGTHLLAKGLFFFGLTWKQGVMASYFFGGQGLWHEADVVI